MIKGLLFDLDGTIISITRDGASFRERTAVELARNGFDMSLIKTEQGVQGMLDQALVQVRRGLVKADFSHVRRQTFRALDELETTWVRDARLIPGVADALSGLDGAVARMGLLTNSGAAAAGLAVERFGLERFFRNVFTRDNLPSMKPSPEGLKAALAIMGLERREAVYVGDSLVDIRAARGAGMRVAAVPSGKYGLEALKAERPDYLLGSLAELRTRLGV